MHWNQGIKVALKVSEDLLKVSHLISLSLRSLTFPGPWLPDFGLPSHSVLEDLCLSQPSFSSSPTMVYVTSLIPDYWIPDDQLPYLLYLSYLPFNNSPQLVILYQSQFPALSLQPWLIIACVPRNEREALIPDGCQNSCYYFFCSTLYFVKHNHDWSHLCLRQSHYIMSCSFPFR